jgi:hypothetical protein
MRVWNCYLRHSPESDMPRFFGQAGSSTVQLSSLTRLYSAASHIRVCRYGAVNLQHDSQGVCLLIVASPACPLMRNLQW